LASARPAADAVGQGSSRLETKGNESLQLDRAGMLPALKYRLDAEKRSGNVRH